MKKVSFWLVCIASLTLAVSSTYAKKKPWSPRKDCTGEYGKRIGAKVKTTKVTMAQLFKSTQKYENKMIQVQGQVTAACRFKGCWMMLKDGKHKMRIRFKGYGFFVPTNSKGYKAVIVGKAKAKTISVKMLRHYAMDAGKPELAKKITKPKKTIAFTAHWVRLSQLSKVTPSKK